jgi:hypothetical protein
MAEVRVRLAACLVAAGLVLGAGGCGVPGSSAPVVVGDAPKLEARLGTDDAQPLGPDGARNGTELVLRYLEAAAWANGTSTEDRPKAMEDAAARVRAFFTDDARAQWRPLSDLTVVQATVGQPKPVGGGKTQVTVDWWSIGTLSDHGWIDTAQAGTATPHTATFEVVQTETGSLRISGGAPPGLLLSAGALTTLYEEHPIYFWDQSDLELLPDLRYLPKSIPAARRPTVVVNWLLDGPSPWLHPIAQRVPQGIEVNGNVAQPDQRPDSPMVVNLSANAARLQDRLPHLVSQLRWSLRPFAGPVQLQIEQHQQGGVDGSTSAYLANNPAYSTGEPDRYCVAGGQITPSELHSPRPALPVMKNPVNSAVVSAAVTHNQMAALVRQAGSDRQQLWLPDRSDPNKDRYIATSVVGRSITMPVWVSWPSAGVLVSVDGELNYVPASGAVPVDVTPTGFEKKISAVALAPDSRRLGLVADGQVYVTTLITGPGNTLTLAPPRLLYTGLTQPVGVAWSREIRLVIAGHNGNASTLAEVSPDGGTIDILPLTNLANLVVTRLAGYPRSPLSGPGLSGIVGLLTVEAGGRTWKVFAGQVEELPPKDRAANAACTAPFFVD